MGLRLVLTLSGLLGWLLGIAHVDWQWAIEHAQVLAGLVHYPPDHPMAAHHAATWSLVSQLGAIGLRAGLTESTLSWILSGVLGVLSCQAIAVTVFALSGRALASLGALFVVIISRAVDWGVAYPIWLYGSAHTYGVMGLSIAALAIGLVGAGALRSAALLAPVGVAVHPPIGAFALAILVIVWLAARADGDSHARRLQRLWLPFAIGVSIALASFIAGLALAPDATAAQSDARPYLLSLLKYWDGHRRAIDWNAGAVRIVAGLAIACAFWLVAAKSLTRPFATHLLRAGVATGALGLLAIAATHIAIDAQPAWLVALMPGRLINLALFLAVPVLVGLSLSMPGRWGAGVTALLVVGLLASRRSLVWPLVFGLPPDAPRPGIDQLTAIGLALIALLIGARMVRKSSELSEPTRDRLASGLRAATALLLAGAMSVTAVEAGREWWRRRDLLRDWRTDPVFGAAHGAGGVLASGDPWLVQLRTRAPVLLDAGAIDVLPYGPSAAPAVERVLQRVYGISLLAPPAGMKPEGRVPVDHTRDVWERYTREDWIKIGREFGVTRVVTQSGWQLDLPSLMFGDGVQVFEIPQM